MKEIIIKSKKYGEYTVLVDDKDYDHLISFKWYLAKRKYTFYAECSPLGLKGKTVSMHRMICGTDSDVIDHIDANGLNNQRSNLRPCTQSQNLANMRLSKHNTSGYKGVCKTSRGTFNAGIYVNNKRIHIGVFKTPHEAALAYNKAAQEYHGNFARLNQVPCAV